MSIRIETLTRQTESEYKYSKNMTIGTKESGVDIGKDQEGGSGPATSIIDDTTASTETTYSSSKIEELIAAIPASGGSITRVTSSSMPSSVVSTSVTVTKEE